jgi:hypothetical protein
MRAAAPGDHTHGSAAHSAERHSRLVAVGGRAARRGGKLVAPDAFSHAMSLVGHCDLAKPAGALARHRDRRGRLPRENFRRRHPVVRLRCPGSARGCGRSIGRTTIDGSRFSADDERHSPSRRHRRHSREECSRTTPIVGYRRGTVSDTRSPPPGCGVRFGAERCSAARGRPPSGPCRTNMCNCECDPDAHPGAPLARPCSPRRTGVGLFTEPAVAGEHRPQSAPACRSVAGGRLMSRQVPVPESGVRGRPIPSWRALVRGNEQRNSRQRAQKFSRLTTRVAKGSCSMAYGQPKR